MTEFEIRYRALASRDARFDGRFFTAVRSTGIYCRPVCPARTPKPENVVFYNHAAAAELDGYRPCRRCRPDLAPTTPSTDLIGRALALMADGVADRDGIAGLARRLAVSERHLHRLFVSELGAPPLAVARSRRAHLARQLLDETDLPAADIAFAAGFASVRAFNETIRHVFDATPSHLRASRRRTPLPGLSLRLRTREPFSRAALLSFLATRAVPGLEEVQGTVYRRVAGDGIIELDLGGQGDVVLRLPGGRLHGLQPWIRRARRLLDLDAESRAIDTALSADASVRSLVRTRPGLRVPGAWDGFEMAARAILGQQVSVRAARTITTRLVHATGTPIRDAAGTLTHAFPSADALAEADLSGLGIPAARIGALRALAAAVANGALDLDGGMHPDEASTRLGELPGVGPWTVAYVRMRALGDPDAFPEGDAGVRNAFRARGLDTSRGSIAKRAAAWQPWRAYAVMHWWTGLSNGGVRS